MAVTWGTPTPTTSRVVQACAGADADEDAVDAGFHEGKGNGIADAVADDDGYADLLAEFVELEAAVAAGGVLGGGDGGLDEEDVGPGLDGDGGQGFGVVGGDGDGATGAGGFYFLDALGHEVGLDGRGVDFLEEVGYFFAGGGNHFFQLGVGVVVAGVEAFKVEDAEAADVVHQCGGGGRDDGVHGGGHDGYVENGIANAHFGAGHFGVDGYLSGNDSHFIEAVGRAKLLERRVVHGGITSKERLRKRGRGRRSGEKKAAG